MDIHTLKLSFIKDYLTSFKINDQEISINKKKYQGYMKFFLDEIFTTNNTYKKIWNKICSSRCNLYFRYNSTKFASLRIRSFNNYIKNINDKILITNLKFDKDDAELIVDISENNEEFEINLEIKFIICLGTESISISHFDRCCDNITLSADDGFTTFYNFTNEFIKGYITFRNPNPFFKFIKIDDYDKKIKSFKLPLYDYSYQTKIKKRINYSVIYDFYPTMTQFYFITPTKIVNDFTNEFYDILLDKECNRCKNHIRGLELNMFSKLQLCCKCNIEKVIDDIDKLGFFKSYKNICININESPAYIIDNFINYQGYKFYLY